MCHWKRDLGAGDGGGCGAGWPSLDEYRRGYYDSSLNYWAVAATFGVCRGQEDRRSKGWGLPSSRYYGRYRLGRDYGFEVPDGTPRRDHYPGRVRKDGLCHRRRLAGWGDPGAAWA